MTFKLKQQLILINTAVIGTASILLVVSLYVLVTHQMTVESQGFLQDEFHEYRLLYQPLLDDRETLSQDLERHFTQARMSFPIFCRTYDAQGNLYVSVSNATQVIATDPKWVQQALLSDKEIPHSLITHNPPTLYRCLVASTTSPTGKTYLFELGLKLDRLQAQKQRLRTQLLTCIPVVMLISWLSAHWLARRALKPFGQFILALQEIRCASLDKRLPVTETHDEVDQLAEAANAMLDDLQQTFRLVQDFTGDAAHELRTPLTRLLMLLENAVTQETEGIQAQACLDQAFQECQQLQRLIDDLVLLTRLDSHDIDGAPVVLDITDMIRDLSELWYEIGQERGVEFQIDLPAEIRVNGHPVLLRRLLSNLIENAFKHTPAGGVITVRAATEAAQALLTVEDSGHGVEASELPKLFNRFYRTSTAHQERVSGTGLGLNICQKIVHLHGGRINVESQAGEGTMLRISLPLNPQTASRENDQKGHS